MSTASLSSPERDGSPLWLKLGLIFILLLVVAAGLSGYWFVSTAKKSLPVLDGTLHVAGLSSPVTVQRDVNGVPHISAANINDLLFAQGFVTSQDRLWQMDTSRRYGRGELSQILGK